MLVVKKKSSQKTSFLFFTVVLIGLLCYIILTKTNLFIGFFEDEEILIETDEYRNLVTGIKKEVNLINTDEIIKNSDFNNLKEVQGLIIKPNETGNTYPFKN